MKARVSKFIGRYRYAVPVLLALLCCAVSAYFIFLRPQIPECRALARATHSAEGHFAERVLLISVIPDGARQVTVLLNGSVFVNNERYVIDRAVKMSYRREGSNYTLHVRENIKKAQDSLTLEALDRRWPLAGQEYHIRIEQIDPHHFLFISNHSPEFVCATS